MSRPGMITATTERELQAQVAERVAWLRARAEERMLARMAAGTYLQPTTAAPEPERMTRQQVEADWRRRSYQPWPSGCGERDGGRAVYGRAL